MDKIDRALRARIDVPVWWFCIALIIMIEDAIHTGVPWPLDRLLTWL